MCRFEGCNEITAFCPTAGGYYLMVQQHAFKCLDAIYSVNRSESERPRGMALATGMQELQAEQKLKRNGTPRVQMSVEKRALYRAPLSDKR
jgi:hypothetical protein